jgi:hypothetical protein
VARAWSELSVGQEGIGGAPPFQLNARDFAQDNWPRKLHLAPPPFAFLDARGLRGPARSVRQQGWAPRRSSGRRHLQLASLREHGVASAVGLRLPSCSDFAGWGLCDSRAVCEVGRGPVPVRPGVVIQTTIPRAAPGRSKTSGQALAAVVMWSRLCGKNSQSRADFPLPREWCDCSRETSPGRPHTPLKTSLGGLLHDRRESPLRCLFRLPGLANLAPPAPSVARFRFLPRRPGATGEHAT